MAEDIRLGLAYSDVLLEPGYTDFARDEDAVSLATWLTRRIELEAPFVSAPMDTVTGSELAIAVAQEGGIGVLHRNMPISEQAAAVEVVKRAGHLVAAAVGVGEGYRERVDAIAEAGVDVICIDTAHGFTKFVIEAITQAKRDFRHIDIIAGSVATYRGAKALIEAGADALRVGMGPASICTTRIVSGVGAPQLTAVLDAARASQESRVSVPIIADGGVAQIGDITKALAAGASTVMLGSLFAGTAESAGAVVMVPREEVPPQYAKLLTGDAEAHPFKQYRGMGSVGAMETGARVSAEDEFHGKTYGGQVMVAEGVEGLVPLSGSVRELCDQLSGGVRSGMYYAGGDTIPRLQQNAQFIRVTAAAQIESDTHDVLVTNPGRSYL